jgi:hypothetical protein
VIRFRRNAPQKILNSTRSDDTGTRSASPSSRSATTDATPTDTAMPTLCRNRTSGYASSDSDSEI